MAARTINQFLTQYHRFKVLMNPNSRLINSHTFSVVKDSRFTSKDISAGQTMAAVLDAAVAYNNLDKFPEGFPYWTRLELYFKAERTDEDLAHDMERYSETSVNDLGYGVTVFAVSSGVFSRCSDSLTALDDSTKVLWRGQGNMSIIVVNTVLNDILPRSTVEYVLKEIYKEHGVDILSGPYEDILAHMWDYTRFEISDELNTLADNAMAIAVEYANQRNIKAMKQSLEVLPTIKSVSNTEVRTLQNDIEQWHGEIRDSEARIARYKTRIDEDYAKITRATKVIHELQKEAQHPFVELTEVFRNLIDSGRITWFNVKTDNANTLNRINLRVRGDIIYWEEDEVDNWFHTFSANTVEYKIVQLLFNSNKRFLYTYEQDVDIKVEGDVRRGELDGDTACDNERKGAPRHPHIGWYDCFGNNSTSFYEAWNNKEYDIALAIMNNALGQISLTDYCVVSRMIQNLTNWVLADAECKCIHDTVTNEYITISEALIRFTDMQTVTENTEGNDDANN